jgi:UDP-glucose 4-epimerase
MLLAEGWDVEGVDDLSSGDIDSLAGLEKRVIHEQMLPYHNKYENDVPGNLLVITGDFASGLVLERVESERYDVIFHLAANPRVGYSVEHPDITTDDNVQKTVELMTAARGNVDEFVFASSSAIYGPTEELPTTESASVSPQSPYGLQKLVVEQFGQLYSALYNMNFTALRFFNVYGPGQDGSSAYATAVSAWCTRLSSGEALRSDGDGTQTRDMVYVEDVSRALIAASSRDDEKGYRVYNVATGESFSNNQILSYLTELFPSTEVNNAPARQGDVKHTLGCSTKIQKELGWSPSVSFFDGLESTLKWWGLR